MTSETPEQTYDYAAAKRRTEWIKGLRDMANFFEQHPQFGHPKCLIINIFTNKEALAQFARIAGWTKEYTDTWFMLRRQFGEDVTLDVNILRGEVCRQVEVGDRLVPAVEAQPARVEKVYEWRCDDLTLLGGK